MNGRKPIASFVSALERFGGRPPERGSWVAQRAWHSSTEHETPVPAGRVLRTYASDVPENWLIRAPSCVVAWKPDAKLSELSRLAITKLRPATEEEIALAGGWKLSTEPQIAGIVRLRKRRAKAAAKKAVL